MKLTAVIKAGSRCQRPRACLTGASALVLFAITAASHAQAANQIANIDPDSAAQGTLSLLVTFTLDNDLPPAPPAGVMPDTVTIGELVGTSVTHSSQYIVTAEFDVPGDEAPGLKDAAVVFTTPDGELTFALAAGFEVLLASDQPPVIVTQPVPQIVAPGGSAIFSIEAYGSEPLEYQWQKDELDIDGATEDVCVIDDASYDDAGLYRCVVSNEFGSAASDEAELVVRALPEDSYSVVDTSQSTCYDELGAVDCPEPGEPFFGQDAQYIGNAPDYVVSGEGLCVFDGVTGLTWQRSADSNGDGVINVSDKMTLVQALLYAEDLNLEAFGGYDDWRVPTIKELYSLIDFRGMDPTSCDTVDDCPGLRPFLDTDYFDFGYGDTDAGERVIDAQYASSTLYVSTVDGELLFGVNFADGRIKGYWTSSPGGDMRFYVICVRGNSNYGINDFVDNGDDTVTDRSTGLMWTRSDSGAGMFWEDALAYAESCSTAGYDDWRLPNVKGLQSILDYARSPDTTDSAAINPLLDATQITNEEGAADYPYYWASTTHVSYPDHGEYSAYLAFGRGLGYMNGQWQDVHGAGCQRSDPKSGDPDDYPFGHGPQGDAIRIYNFVRCVRDLSALPGDLTGDGCVDQSDLGTLLAAYETDAGGDLDGDGDTDQSDLGLLLAHYGEGCV